MRQHQTNTTLSLPRSEMTVHPDPMCSLQNALTRIFDLAIALIGTVLFIFLLPVMALLIKFDSPGPIFYTCKRIGKGGRIFNMYKFRTMFEMTVPIGGSVSPQGDPRVTPIGSILRRTKLNEFPQFLNVIKGDMSIVGPRPETPDLAAFYPREAMPIFSVRPGLLGPNQIIGRNEDEFYPPGVDPVNYYLNDILPKKLPLDLKYVKEKSAFTDLKYLFLGAWATIIGAVQHRHLTDNLAQIYFLIGDAALAVTSFSLAYFLRFSTLPFTALDPPLIKIHLLAVFARIPFLILCGCYQTLIRYLAIRDLKQIFVSVTLGSVAFITTSYFLSIPINDYGRTVFALDWLFLSTLLIASRITVRFLQKLRDKGKAAHLMPIRVLIVGAGEEGYSCLRFLQESIKPTYLVVGFIDKDHRIRNRRIEGVRVLGDHYHLDVLCRLYSIQALFISDPRLPSNTILEIRETCARMGVMVKSLVTMFSSDIS